MTSRPPLLPDPTMRAAARTIYGADPAAYEAGRPEYPERVYRILAERCGLRSGSRVVEIGPGTGRATRRLLDAGAQVLAVEPDPGLAAYLASAMTSTALTVVQATFEAADLEEGIADLVVAGMSFHWVDQVLGLPKLRRLLRPGGSAALWWTVYGDPARPDPFADAAAGLVGRAGGQPDPVSGLPFELDADAWRTSLERDAGLVDVATERIPWMVRLDAAGVRALYGSTMTVLRRPEPERLALLDELERIADQAFHGLVERPFVTAIHTGRREA